MDEITAKQIYEICEKTLSEVRDISNTVQKHNYMLTGAMGDNGLIGDHKVFREHIKGLEERINRQSERMNIIEAGRKASNWLLFAIMAVLTLCFTVINKIQF